MTDTAVIFDIIGRDKTSSAIKGSGSAFNKLALGIAAGAAFAADKLVKMAADFQSSTNRLVTSAGETQTGLDTVRKGILAMAGQVGDSSAALATAMYTIESGGQHGADGLKVLQAAAEGAKAEGADLTTVADAVTSVLQDYHLKASDSALVTSQMVAAVGAGKTTFEEFAGSLSSVLPIASASHIAFTDISAAIASMTVHGMSAQQATQNLSDTINHMNSPTAVQTKELAQLGIASGDLTNMLGSKGLTGTLQTISQAILQHMGPDGKVMLDAFNKSTSAAADANKMIAAMPANLQTLAHSYQAGTTSLGDWRKTLKTLPPEQANMLSQFAALQSNASGFSDILKSGQPAAQSYQAALAKATGDATGLNVALMLTGENTSYVNGAIKAVSSATTEAGGHVKGWADVQSTFNQRVAETKAALGAVGIQIGNALMPVVQSLISNGIQPMAMWMAKNEGATRDIAIAVGIAAGAFVAFRLAVTAAKAGAQLWMVATKAWSAAVKVATAVQWLWNAAMDLSPIMLVVIGVAALAAGIYLLWTHSAGFRDFFIGMWNGIWSVLKAVGGWFAGPFASFFVGAGKAIATAALWLWHNVIDPVWQGISAAAQMAYRIYSSASNLIRDLLVIVIGGAVTWLWHSNIEPAFQGVATIALWLYNNVLKPVADATVIAFTAVGTAAVWLWHNAIEPAAKGIGAAALWLYDNAIMPAFHGIADVANWLWHNVLSPVFNFIAGALSKLGSGSGSVFSSIGHAIKGAFGSVANAVKGQFNDVIGVIDKAIGGVNHLIRDANKFPGVNFPTLGTIPKLATGGIVQVGERGTEIVRLPGGSAVYPHGSVPSDMAGGGGTLTLETRGGNSALGTLIHSLVRSGDLQLSVNGQRVRVAGGR